MEYNDQVRELLESYHDEIEIKVMPNLSKEFTNFYSGVGELFGKLKNKGLLKDDPYFKDSEITELKTPDRSNFPDAEAQWKVAERITEFKSILSYISNNYSFSLNTFNFSELEKMKKFLDYYDWKGLLNPSTTELNTRTFGKIVITYRTSSLDSLVIKTFDNCIENIIKSVDAIFINLKIIHLYLKESYKQFIRIDILPIILEKFPEVGKSNMADYITDEIKGNYSYLKVYKKYIAEVVKEELYDEGKKIREDVIKKLTLTKKSETKEVKDEFDPEKELLNILMEIGKVRVHISAAIEKINQSHILNIGHETNPIIKFFKMISRMLFNITPKTMYELNLKSKNENNRNLILHYEKFYDEIKKLEFDLLSFTEEDKIINYIKINESNLNNNIDRLLITLKKQTTIFIGLDDFLKTELKAKNIKGKGIKPELTVVKSLLHSITTHYREYLDKIDEK